MSERDNYNFITTSLFPSSSYLRVLSFIIFIELTYETKQEFQKITWLKMWWSSLLNSFHLSELFYATLISILYVVLRHFDGLYFRVR